EQPPVGGNVGDERHLSVRDVLEHHNRLPAGALQLEHQGGRLMPKPDRLADAHDFVGEILLHHAQESAQALLIDVGGHELPRDGSVGWVERQRNPSMGFGAARLNPSYKIWLRNWRVRGSRLLVKNSVGGPCSTTMPRSVK